MKEVLLYWHTLRYLKFRQIVFRIYYLFKKFWITRSRHKDGGQACRVMTKTNTLSFLSFQRKLESRILWNEGRPRLLVLQECISSPTSYSSQSFTFLNLSHAFSGSVDWHFQKYGKLWQYHVHYFDYLNQVQMLKEEGLSLIRDFMRHASTENRDFEPYPASVRMINWIKFLTRHSIEEAGINSFLFGEAWLLCKNLEYHLLGNHLLENGFALLFASYYFGEMSFYKKARKILKEELDEQILPDGGHFELSPMYHQLILNRVLDCINLLKNNRWDHNDLISFLSEKASLILGWSDQMNFENGDIPLLNDSAFGIAPALNALFDYAVRLGVEKKPHPLKESGYRKIKRGKYEIVLDVGEIGPEYIPGHAHSDTFNFVLYVDGKPFIVDTGTSTYEANDLRLSQRRTSAHNTVEVNGLDQSEVWSSFRVGRRAYVQNLVEGHDEISAFHTGYRRIGVGHKRTFKFSDQVIQIRDELNSKKKCLAHAFLHFYPGVVVREIEGGVDAGGKKIVFKGFTQIVIRGYDYAPEFNKLIPAKMVIVSFQQALETQIWVG